MTFEKTYTIAKAQVNHPLSGILIIDLNFMKQRITDDINSQIIEIFSRASKPPPSLFNCHYSSFLL
jgi:hypothetical protein